MKHKRKHGEEDMMQYHIFYFEKNPEASYNGCKTNTFLSLDRFQGDKQLKNHNLRIK